MFNRAMRSWFVTVILASVVLLATASAHARPLALSKRFETTKMLGLGVTLGVPSGVSGKLMFTPEWAVDLGVGAYLAYRDRDGMHVHADLLWQPFVAVEGQSFLAPMYFGIGPRILRHDEITHIGVRIPVGISFMFDKTPVDIFLEGAFVYDFSISEPAVDQESPGAVDVNGLVGVRYFFK